MITDSEVLFSFFCVFAYTFNWGGGCFPDCLFFPLPQILVDLVYELGANANLEQRSEISQRLAACALRTGSQEVQAQVSHLLLSLNWTA